MAQASPRSCLRCGTPLQENMRRCAACGLPVEAIFNRSGNIPRRPRVTHSTESQTQQDATSTSLTPDDSLATWDMPTTLQPSYPDPASQRISQELPLQQDWQTPSSSLHESEAPWHAPSNPFVHPDPTPQQDWQTPSGSPHEPEMTWHAPSNPADPTPRHANQEPPLQQNWQTPSSSNPLRSPEMAPQRFTQNPSRGQRSFYTPAPPPKRNRRLIVLIILLVILLLLGGGSYFAVSILGLHVTGLGKTQSQIKTTNLNTTVTYAGADITIANVQQAQNFLDDPQSTDDGMIRLRLTEQNKTGVAINGDYNTIARLIVRGDAAIKPLYVKSKSSLAANVTQTSLIDFPVLNGGTLSKMTFQLGGSDEAQIQIPLSGQTNLAQYQPQTKQQQATTAYFGLNWTLIDSITSLNIPGTQAPKGMEYLTLDLQVDSPLTQEAITGSPFDYMKLKGGGKTVSLVNTTLPISFAAGATGQKGTALFLIPQKSSACSLVLVSQDPGGSGQASLNFQL